jgi:trans-aconitate methyltransferase
MADNVNEVSDEISAARAEVERAAQHYYHTPLQAGIDNRTKRYIVERCAPYIRGPQVLELGYVDGLWTSEILARKCSLDIVEGATRHVEHARKVYGANSNVRIFHGLFQQFEPDTTYDTVIAGDMLRYLPEPAAFLQTVKTWLNDDGCLIATIPNSRSLHRRIGSLMNLEPTPVEANQRDIEVGNRRSYDRYEFRNLLMQGGFEVTELHGCFLKPLSSNQMQDWDERLLRAFLEIGNELEDYCWFIYAVCRKDNQRDHLTNL